VSLKAQSPRNLPRPLDKVMGNSLSENLVVEVEPSPEDIRRLEDSIYAFNVQAIYWLVSTWNPYEVTVMRTTIARDSR
jgi:hypothetical protein